MIASPFDLFRPFEDAIDVRFLIRDDNISTDSDIARATGAEKIASLKQVHGNRAVRIDQDSRRVEQADAIATDTKGLTLTIRFADCQGLVVYAPQKNVACVIHAGWRGLKDGIIERSFTLLKNEWKIDPADTFVIAGPSLCLQCADFTDPAREAPELAAYISSKSIDLRRAADDKLFALGVKKDHLERSPQCTRCTPSTYWTYRGGDRDKVSAGFINAFAVTLR